MVLSLIEYGDIIYAGTTNVNLGKLDKLFYRGLRIHVCDGTNNWVSKDILCDNCNIDPSYQRGNVDLVLFMHKQIRNADIIKRTQYALDCIKPLYLILINQIMKKQDKMYYIEVLIFGISYQQMIGI